MDNVILFGASKLGEIAYIMLKDKYNIIKYCDNDKSKKGNKINDIEIININELNKYEFDKIIICSQYYKEISEQLIDLGIYNYEVFRVNFNTLNGNIDTKENLDIKQINLGRFLSETNKSISLKDLTFIHGTSSGILDYAFLKALMLKFNFKTYLEIGSFLGTSISIISEIAEKCYSITLPDDTLEDFFKSKNKNNFGSYFMRDKENIICFNENSREFDYSKVKSKVDLVFIDGDHSYEGIYHDSKNIFKFIDLDNTIVVWHDFKAGYHYRIDTIRAVYNSLPSKMHRNIFAVDNNICGIYIPDKYMHNFSFDIEKDILYSYKIDLISKKNCM